MDADEILLEVRAVGNVLRVAAIDAATLREIVFQAPVQATEHEIRRLAAARMALALARTPGRSGTTCARSGTYA